MAKILQLSDDNETYLIEGCRKQNRQAQQQLYQHYQNQMMAVCIRYLKDEDEAFEVLNQSFLKVFEKIAQFKAETKLENWIKRIVINTVIDHIRKNKSYKQNFIQTHEFSSYGKPDDENDDISDWWHKATSISSDVLLNLVSQLPPATRLVFNLYSLEGFNHREIATKMGVSEGTSKWHLSNARSILKEKVIEIINKGIYNNESRRTKKH